MIQLRTVGAGVLSFLAAGCLAAAGGEFEVKLTVQESAGLARTAEPVSGGIPLPRGAVKDPAAMKLLDAEGKEVPAQFSAINRWAADGSVMWLLVQSTATVPAKGQVAYTLKSGAAGTKRSLLKVEDGADAVTVETGKIRFVVGKKKANLLDGAWLDADGDGKYADAEQVVVSDPRGGAVLTIKNGEVYTSGASTPKEVVVEESGPERAIVMVKGLLAAEGGKGALPWCYGYIVRIRAYAGEPYLRISYCFTDDANPPIGSPEMKDSAVGIPLKLSGEITAGLGGKTAASGALAEGKEAALVCSGSDPNKLYGVTMVEPKLSGLDGKVAAGDLGWAAATNGKLGASLSVRHLRENWPAVLRARREKDRVWLELKPWPAEVETERYLDVCTRKTYELQLTLAAGGAAIEKSPELLTAQNDALRFWPPAEWTLATGAWGDFGGLALLDDAARKALDREPLFGDTGWRLFGACGEMESGSSRAPGGGYEPLLKDSVYYNGYMQTGQRRLFDQIERTSWHWRDRRMIFMDADVSASRWEGNGSYQAYARKGVKDFPAVQSTSLEKKFGAWNYGGAWGPMDTQHFSVDEVVAYYYLTGDRQCIDALNKYAEQAGYLARTSIESVKKSGSSRANGWTTRALMTVYEATGEKRWFELSRDAAHAICEGMDKTAGTISPAKPVGRAPDPKLDGQTPFMAAVVGMSLGRYYRHQPEAEVRDAILGIADWMYYDIVKPGGGFSYHWFINDPGGRSVSGNRCMSTMAWAYLATGQKRYLEAADAHGAIMKLSGWYLNGFGQEYINIKTGKRADDAPPAAVKDLAAEALGGGKVKLTWTAPGNDGDKGTAAEYQVKFSAKEIKEHCDWRNEADKAVSFWAATNCKNEPKPAAAGAKETYTAEGVPAGTCWFALKSYDGQPNQSDLSNVVKVEVK